MNGNMFNLLKRLADSWAAWLGDRDLEIALRRHLSSHDFFGDSATIRHLRLRAVQRPGWVQVLTFNAEVASKLSGSTAKQALFGVVKQDERFESCEIEVYPTLHERNRKLHEWSEGLLTTRDRR